MSRQMIFLMTISTKYAIVSADFYRKDFCMNKKLAIFDLDGTLTNSEKKVTPATKAAVLDIMERGHKCILASGRPVAGITHIAKELEFETHGGYILAYNGAKILNYQTNEVIYQQTVDHALLPLLFSFAKEHNCGIMTYSNDAIISGNGINQYVNIESFITGLPIKEVENFAEYISFPINKCLMCTDPDHAAECEILLRNLVGDRLNVFRSEPFFIEITPIGVDKAASLEKILPILDIKQENCIAFGDGFNDISMIKFAGIGVAMGNAQQVVKDAADIITLTNDEDGIIPILQKYFS